MIFKTIASGSTGNSYILESNSGEMLMIEAGIPFNKIKPKIDFKISSIKGCIFTHEHLDHSKSIKEVLTYSIPCYSGEKTVKSMGMKHYNLFPIEPMETINIGSFEVMGFEVPHDVPCLAYLIKHPEMGLMLFATDCYYIPNKIKGLNFIAIEANYDLDILNRNIRDGKVHPVVRKRVLQSHMSIKAAERMLLSNDLSKVRNIALIHLSSGNSNGPEFKKRIQGKTGIPTEIAEAGIEIHLNNLK